MDELAEAVEEDRLLRQHALPRERRLEPERAQLLHGMRQEIDADAERLDLRRRLEDAAGNAGALQHETEREAADPGADDQHIRHRRQRPLKRGLRFSTKARTPSR